MDPVRYHYTLPKKGNLQQLERTIAQSAQYATQVKSSARVLLNRLKPQVESIIAEEQAGFRSGRSTTEQIFNLRILCERYLQHQQDLYQAFTDLIYLKGRLTEFVIKPFGLL